MDVGVGENAVKQPTVMQMEAIWRDAIRRADRDGKIACITVTSKQRGQLKNIRRVAADAGVEAGSVIEWAVRAWRRFGWAVCGVKGLSSAPTEPHIGFLLAHSAVAINEMTDEAAKAKAQPWKSIAPRPDTVPAERPMPTTGPEEERTQRATLAEVEELLQMFR